MNKALKRFNLKSYRERQGLTQEDMAKKLEISKEHYSNIERGVFDPSFGLLEKFSEIFEYDDIWFLFKKGA